VNTLREGLPPLPAHMLNLPIDARGYPVPFFVGWVDGVPDFRTAAPAALKRCIVSGVCWICGRRLGQYRTFVSGPLAGINRCSGEPPSHIDCARFAVQACPFIVLPKAQRREANLPDDVQALPGIHLERNPGVCMLWTVKIGPRPSYKIEAQPGGGVLFRLDGEPDSLTFWAGGQRATREQVEASVSAGLPALEALCENFDDRNEVRALAAQFAKLLDKRMAS
jgi:hypothetical protein